MGDRKFDFILGRGVSAIPAFLGFTSHLINGSSAAPARPLAYMSTQAPDETECIGPGLLYLRGGSFADELQEAGITQSQRYSVAELVGNLESDKFVLHIKAEEIIK